jgi:hypothetical protein
MFRRFPLLALCFAVLLCGASAQQTVTLGNGTVVLNGPLKFHTGDDMAWAQPDYDDSAWDKMDLTLPASSFDSMAAAAAGSPAGHRAATRS